MAEPNIEVPKNMEDLIKNSHLFKEMYIPMCSSEMYLHFNLECWFNILNLGKYLISLFNKSRCMEALLPPGKSHIG